MQVGDIFAGCLIRSSSDTHNGHSWVFERDDHSVRIELSSLDYASFCLDGDERARILEQMASRIAHELFRDKASVYGE